MKSVFIYNPESGKGKIQKYEDYILSKLRSKYGEVECIKTKYQGHAYNIAKSLSEEYSYLFVSGGDGTLNEIVNGLENNPHKPVVGYIPSGTVNDIARSLGISRNIKKAVQTILDGFIIEHDTFKVNDRYGIYVCASGLFTKSSYDTERYKKKKFGKIAYFASGVSEIRKTKPLPVTIEYDDQKIQANTGLMLILNSKSVAGFKLNKKASLSDGKVEVLLFHSHKKHITLVDQLRIVNAFLFGVNRYKNKKNVTYRLLSDFKIDIENGATINLDGEKSGEGSFNFHVLQKSLKIIAPKEA